MSHRPGFPWLKLHWGVFPARGYLGFRRRDLQSFGNCGAGPVLGSFLKQSQLWRAEWMVPSSSPAAGRLVLFLLPLLPFSSCRNWV